MGYYNFITFSFSAKNVFHEIKLFKQFTNYKFYIVNNYLLKIHCLIKDFISYFTNSI